MLDFRDKLILRNVYKSRELHPLTSALSWGRVTMFSKNGSPAAMTKEFLVEVIHFLLLEEDRAGSKNFTVMFMMLMNINHRAIWPNVVALGRVFLAKGMCFAFGIILFREQRNRNNPPFMECQRVAREERVMDESMTLNGGCKAVVSEGSGTCDRTQNYRMAWAERDLNHHSVPAPCHGDGCHPPDHVKRVRNSLWFWELAWISVSFDQNDLNYLWHCRGHLPKKHLNESQSSWWNKDFPGLNYMVYIMYWWKRNT